MIRAALAPLAAAAVLALTGCAVATTDPLEVGDATASGPLTGNTSWGAVYVQNEGEEPVAVDAVRLLDAGGVRLQPDPRLVRSDVTWDDRDPTRLPALEDDTLGPGVSARLVIAVRRPRAARQHRVGGIEIDYRSDGDNYTGRFDETTFCFADAPQDQSAC